MVGDLQVPTWSLTSQVTDGPLVIHPTQSVLMPLEFLYIHLFIYFTNTTPFFIMGPQRGLQYHPPILQFTLTSTTQQGRLSREKSDWPKVTQ